MAVRITRKKVDKPKQEFSEFQKGMVPAGKAAPEPKLKDPNWDIIHNVRSKAQKMKPADARDYLDRMANLWGPEVKTHQEIIKLIDDL